MLSSGEQSKQLPEQDRLVVAERMQEVIIAATRVLDLEARLGEAPREAAPSVQQPDGVHDYHASADRITAQAESDIATIAAREAVNKAQRGDDYALAA